MNTKPTPPLSPLGSPSCSVSSFRCVVADPPWEYKGGFNGFGNRKELPYAHMDLADIKAMPVADLIEREGYLFLWTTNRWLERAFEVARAWECTPRQTLTWCKPTGGKGLGGMFATNTEFVIVAQKIREGTNAHGARTKQKREGSSWFEWPKQKHSQKPEAFQDMLERVCHGPYLELFARRTRLGWSTWGNEVPCDITLSSQNVRDERPLTAKESNG